MNALKQWMDELEKLDIQKLASEYTMIADSLPNYDDDPILVAILPTDDATVANNNHGVLGTALYGNIMMQVNPTAHGYNRWMKYVFAHEYHHSVWGNYWLNLHSGELPNSLLTALVSDGEADGFAMPMDRQLEPRWLYLHEDAMIEQLFNEKYRDHLYDTDFDYPSMMFGDEQKGICWCGGYAVGCIFI